MISIRQIEERAQSYQDFDADGNIRSVVNMSRDELLDCLMKTMDAIEELEDIIHDFTYKAARRMDKYWGE